VLWWRAQKHPAGFHKALEFFEKIIVTQPSWAEVCLPLRDARAQPAALSRSIRMARSRSVPYAPVTHWLHRAVQGYNKRATALYLLGRFDESVEDCKMTLNLEVSRRRPGEATQVLLEPSSPQAVPGGVV
jgi:hypothetical protein